VHKTKPYEEKISKQTFIADPTCCQGVPINDTSGYARPDISLRVVLYKGTKICEPKMRNKDE
jgi:hypothetical protein